MAELVDALASGASDFIVVGVQVSLWAPQNFHLPHSQFHFQPVGSLFIGTYQNDNSGCARCLSRNPIAWRRLPEYQMKKKLPITCAAILLSGCISPYEYKDCGVLYDKPTANMHGTGGNLLPDTWSDVTVAFRSENQDHFFKNNACMLTGKMAQAPN